MYFILKVDQGLARNKRLKEECITEEASLELRRDLRKAVEAVDRIKQDLHQQQQVLCLAMISCLFFRIRIIRCAMGEGM